jgi:hypothetical protein
MRVSRSAYEKCHSPLEGYFQQAEHKNASREHERTLWPMQYVLTTWISRMPSKPIRIETCPVLPLFAYFHASNISHFSFLDHFARFVGMMKRPAPSDAFQADAIQFEEAKARQSDGDGSFTLSLDVSVKISLMVV